MTDSNDRDLWAEMMAAPKPHRIVPLPRLNAEGDAIGEVAIVMMTAEESALVTRDAEVKAKRMLKDAPVASGEHSKGYDDLFNRYSAEGILFTSVRKANKLAERFFTRREDIFKTLTVDEVGVLLNHYYTVQIELGPIIAQLDDATADQWIKRLQEGGTQARFFLNSFSAVALNDLILSLVSRLATSQTDSSSAGEQPASTS